MQRERWKRLKGYDYDYKVSSCGRVWIPDRTRKFRDGRVFHYRARITDGYRGAKGYRSVALYSKGVKLERYVHVLVLTTFVKKPGRKYMTNHKDGIKKNNDLRNLEWVTNQENTIHSIKTGLRKFFVGGHPTHRVRRPNPYAIVSALAT